MFIASTFELGAGRSVTVILRRTPGASLVQSPIAALPIRSLASSVAASMGAMKRNASKRKIAQQRRRTARRTSILFPIVSPAVIAWVGTDDLHQGTARD